MNVALVLCPFWGTVQYPSFAIPILTAVLKAKGHKVAIFDLNKELYLNCSDVYRDIYLWQYSVWSLKGEYSVREFIKANDKIIQAYMHKIIASGAQIIGFSVYETTKEFSIEISKRIKEIDPSKIIVFGGPECFDNDVSGKLIEEESVDYIVVGEGDETFPELLDLISSKDGVHKCRGIYYKRDGKKIFSGDRPAYADINSLPFPDYNGSIDSNTEELKFLPIMSSRGCINRCNFCTECLLWGKYRSMSGERIYKEIIYQYAKYNVNNFIFYDSLINGNIKELIRFCDLMINRNKSANSDNKINWIAQSTIRREMNPEILIKMKQAGCHKLSYGIESGSQNVIDKMNKKYSLDEAFDILKNTHNADIKVMIYLMVGYPEETEDNFTETLEFIKKLRPFINDVIISQSCIISKGTNLYNFPEKYGISGKEHPIYWNSDNGRNNFEERFIRYEKLCGLLAELGLMGSIEPFGEKKEGNNIEKIEKFRRKPDKWILLSEYYKYTGEPINSEICVKETGNNNYKFL